MALKIENSSGDCRLTSKRKLGLTPYIRPTGATIAAEIIRCRFFKKGDVALVSQIYKNNSNTFLLLLIDKKLLYQNTIHIIQFINS
jgi:hypothetical protein